MKKEEFLIDYFTSLNEANICYFVYGSYKSLPFDTDGSDIDMIIEPEQFNESINLLKRLLIDNDIALVSFYSSKTSSFIRLLCTEEWGVQLDLIKGWYHKGKIYYPTHYLKSRIIIHNGIVRTLEEQAGMYIDFFKEVITIGTAKQKYILGVINEINQNRELRLPEIENLYGKKARKLLEDNLSEKSLESIIPTLQNIMIKAIHKNDWLQRAIMRIESFKRLAKRPGYVIAIEGTDGSGKSCIINSITPKLNEAFHKGIIYRHLRPHVIPDIAVLFGKKKANNSQEKVSNPHELKPSGFFGSFLRWIYYLLDYTLGFYLTVAPMIYTKSIVFTFDRYYYDYYLDPLRARISLPSWLLKFGERIVPSPDLIICLGGNPEIIYNRKPETSLEEVKRQTNALSKFCSLHKNAVWIDTTKKQEESEKDAFLACFKEMNKRFSINDLK